MHEILSKPLKLRLLKTFSLYVGERAQTTIQSKLTLKPGIMLVIKHLQKNGWGVDGKESESEDEVATSDDG